MPMTLTAEDHRAIAVQVVELLRAPAATEDVLTRPEARAYVKRPSEGAFCEWCQKWGVSPRSRGRYSRAKLDLALEREAGTAHTPAAMKRQQLARA